METAGAKKRCLIRRKQAYKNKVKGLKILKCELMIIKQTKKSFKTNQKQARADGSAKNNDSQRVDVLRQEWNYTECRVLNWELVTDIQEWEQWVD